VQLLQRAALSLCQFIQMAQTGKLDDMAELTFSITTEVTGLLTKTFTITDADAQRIFAAQIGQARSVATDTGELRPAKLGDCLTMLVSRFVTDLLDSTVSYEKAKSEINPIQVSEK
jgi:hypothetical protein